MKNLIKPIAIAITMTFAIIFIGCSENENLLQDETLTEISTKKDLVKSARAACDNILKVSTSGNKITYSYPISGFSNPIFKWTVKSGSMSIDGISTNQTVEVSFDVDNFTGGELEVDVYEHSDPTGIHCGDILTLSERDCPNPCAGISGTIIEDIDACFPASHPYGRYHLNYAGDNDDVTWSVDYGTVTSQSGASQVHVAAASLDPFTLTATISNDGGCVKQISKVFYPCDAGSGGFGK